MKLGPRGKQVVAILKDFGEYSSTHAIPHITQAATLWLVVVWSIISTLAIALAVYLIYNNLNKYFSYPVQLNPRLLTDETPFPIITFCATNPWKLSGTNGTPLAPLIDAYNSGAASDVYGFEAPFTMRETIRAGLWTQLMFDELLAADQNSSSRLGYALDEILISCAFLNAECDLSWFTDFYDATYGHCYQFNTNGTFASKSAGPNSAFQVRLSLPADDYLPWTMNAGIVYTLTNIQNSSLQNESVLLTTNGNFAALGRGTSVGMQLVLQEKLSKPFSSCADDSEGILDYYEGIYVIDACLRSCLQDTIIKTCNCYTSAFPHPPNTTVGTCYNLNNTNEAIDCVASIENSANTNQSTFNIANTCNCPYACNQTYYAIVSSEAAWPAPRYMPRQCLSASASWSSTDECKIWFSNNTLYIEFYYQHIYWKKNEEEEAYKLVDALADTGGSLGLCNGMSIISILEFFVLIFVLLLYLIVRPKRTNVEGFNYWKQFEQEIEDNRNDDDPDLIYGDSEKEEDAPLPPKVQDAIDAPAGVADVDAADDAAAAPAEAAAPTEAAAPAEEAKTDVATNETKPESASAEAKPADKEIEMATKMADKDNLVATEKAKAE